MAKIEDEKVEKTSKAAKKAEKADTADKNKAEDVKIEDAPKAETELEVATRLAAEYKDMALRARAEFENYRKNNLNVAKETRERATADVLEDLLPLLDGFDRAEKAIKDEKTLEGLCIIKEQFMQVLKQYEVTPIDAVGKPFDPKFHNCVMRVPDKDKIGLVIFEAQKGYMIKDKVLRHSVVAVGGEENPDDIGNTEQK